MARSITVIPARQSLAADAENSQNVRKLRMAAYCRVSTDQEEQLLSYENQLNYYTGYINIIRSTSLPGFMPMRESAVRIPRSGMSLTG